MIELCCRFIESTNRKKLTYSLGVNHLTDRSDDELKIMRGYRPSKDPKGGEFFTSDVTDVPQEWDWRLQGELCSRLKVLISTILMG